MNRQIKQDKDLIRQYIEYNDGWKVTGCRKFDKDELPEHETDFHYYWVKLRNTKQKQDWLTVCYIDTHNTVHEFSELACLIGQDGASVDYTLSTAMEDIKAGIDCVFEEEDFEVCDETECIY